MEVRNRMPLSAIVSPAITTQGTVCTGDVSVVAELIMAEALMSLTLGLEEGCLLA